MHVVQSKCRVIAALQGLGAETNATVSAFIRFTPSSLAVSVVVLRDIEPGEEITITCMGEFSVRLCL